MFQQTRMLHKHTTAFRNVQMLCNNCNRTTAQVGTAKESVALQFVPGHINHVTTCGSGQWIRSSMHPECIHSCTDSELLLIVCMLPTVGGSRLLHTGCRMCVSWKVLLFISAPLPTHETVHTAGARHATRLRDIDRGRDSRFPGDVRSSHHKDSVLSLSLSEGKVSNVNVDRGD